MRYVVRMHDPGLEVVNCGRWKTAGLAATRRTLLLPRKIRESDPETCDLFAVNTQGCHGACYGK